MWRVLTGQTRRFQPSFHHPANVNAGHWILRKFLRFARGGAKEGTFSDGCGFHVGQESQLEVVPDRDFA
jgi:hypothetical protein